MKNKNKDLEQKKALDLCLNTDGNVLLSMATGAGKSKIPIDYIKANPNISKVAILVPTEELRDNNWRDEFDKWNALNIWEEKVESHCYASGSKIKGNQYDLVIMDEAHRITDLSFEFFKDNNISKIIALTATEPEQLSKIALFDRLNFEARHVLTLDEAIEKGIVADYKITVIYTMLDDNARYVKAGNKNKPFYTTEKKQYDYFTKTINRIGNNVFATGRELSIKKALELKRMHLIYNLRSKLAAARYIKDEILDKDSRKLFFCGSIEQAEMLCDYTIHSKTDDKDLESFKKGTINQLASVNVLNEGVNIENVDGAMVVQLRSSQIQFIQRIGRTLRIRPGHKSNIYVIVCKDTQDEVWMQNALRNLDQSKIEYKPLKVFIDENKQGDNRET